MSEEFLEKMSDLLDTEQEIKMDTELKEIEEWDSLSFVSFLAVAQTTYKKNIAPTQLKQAKTIQDLYDLVK